MCGLLLIRLPWFIYRRNKIVLTRHGPSHATEEFLVLPYGSSCFLSDSLVSHTPLRLPSVIIVHNVHNDIQLL